MDFNSTQIVCDGIEFSNNPAVHLKFKIITEAIDKALSSKTGSCPLFEKQLLACC